MRPWCLVLLVLLTGCAPRAPQGPDTLYQLAQREFRLGNLEAALDHVDAGLRGPLADGVSPWNLKLLVLRAEILVATGKAGEALELLEGREPSGPEARDLSARLLLVRGLARQRQGELEPSRRLLDEAYDLAARAGSPGLSAEIDLRIGATLFQLGDRETAEARFRNALDNARSVGDSYLEISALGNLGTSLLLSSRYDEAIPWYEQILPLSRKEGYQRLTARSLHNLGICHYSLGDWDRALLLLKEAESLYRDVGEIPPHAACLGSIGNVYYSQNDLRAAMSYYRKAVELTIEVKDPRAAGWLSNLAMTAIEAGDLASARQFNRQAIELAEAAPTSGAEVFAAINYARIAAEEQQYEEAETAYRNALQQAAESNINLAVAEIHARLGSLFARMGDWPRARVEFRELSALIRETSARMARDEWKMSFQSSLVAFYRDYVELLMDRGRADEALAVAESFRARLLAEKLGRQRDATELATAAGFRASARAGQAVLLSYWVAPRRSFLWVVTPTKVNSFMLPPEKELQTLVEAYTNLILNLEDPRSTRNPTGRLLYELLLAPATELIPRGSNVIVVPDGPLYQLNFETLLAGEEQPRYWIEDVTVAVTPSLEVFRASPQERRPVARSLLLIGSPVPPGPEFPPLPDADVEIDSIRRRFPDGSKRVLTGAEAHPGAYREASPGQFSLIHFSAHARASRESPLDSAVILSRRQDSFKLYARDVATLPLAAELVTISACRGAGARLYSGEGLVGFSWAFLHAGARNVIAGLWDVNDRSTATLMSRLYEEMDRGKGPAEALRTAKLALLEDPLFGRPFFWAPFELFTRDAPFGRS